MKEVDPIKDKNDIKRIYKYLRDADKVREAELLIIGCNVALRISDLLSLEVSQISRTPNGEGSIDLVEQKTQKFKRMMINMTAMKAIDRLLDHYKAERNFVPRFIFQATGNRVGKEEKPVSRQHISNWFKQAERDLFLRFPFGTHSMRKTFGYHAYKNGEDIYVLQKLFQHSDVKITFRYIGITAERVADAYSANEISIDI